MTAERIARALGGAHRSGSWWRCVCPVHGSRTGRSLTLALRDGEHGLVTVCHAGCDRDVVLAELRRRGLIDRDGRGDVSPADDRADDRHDRERRIGIARRIWNAARDARGTPVERYLAGRGIAIPVPPSMRWKARCWHREERSELPAMIGAVLDVEGRLVAVHRTYLSRNDRGQWRRRDRASLGPIGGGAVRLATMRPSEWLVIGEGIETVMTVMQCEALPGWAALSASGIQRLLLPRDARMVLIVADHDPNGTGERAAHNAARRWLREGRRVRIALPPRVGDDANDLLMEPRSVAA